MDPLSFAPALTLAVLAAVTAQQPQKQKDPPTPLSLTKALAKATVHNQRVLAIFAADGDDVVARFKKDKTLSRPLLYEFEMVQFQAKDGDPLALQMKLPDAVQAKPTLVVLDTAGAVLTHFAPTDFIADGQLQGKPLLDKLTPLFCKPVDAEQKLAAAIAVAKKDGRAVFVRFDAPW